MQVVELFGDVLDVLHAYRRELVGLHKLFL